MLHLRLSVFFLLLVISSGLFAQNPDAFTCTDDIKTVVTKLDKEVVFCGTPSAIKVVSSAEYNRILIDFGGAFPNNTFTVTISGKVSGAEHEKLKERFEGKELMVKGTVQLYKEKPQINVQHMEDIGVK